VIPAVELDARYVASSETIESQLGDETVLLHTGKSTYFGLDAVGTVIWAQLKAGATPREIGRFLRKEFGGAPAERAVEADVLVFMGQLAEQGLVTRE